MATPDGRLTRADLERMQCSTPGCEHRDHPELYLNQACHPRAYLQARYVRGGPLVLECAECRREVASIEVAGP